MRKILSATITTIAIAIATPSNAATFNDVVWRAHAGKFQLACMAVTVHHGVIVRERFTTPWLATFTTKAAADRAARGVDCE